MQPFTQTIYNKIWAITFISRISILFFQHRYQTAEELCRKGINIAPRNPVYHEWLGKILWKESKLEEAIQEYRVAIGLQKATLLADRMDLINLLIEAKHYEEALAESHKLLDPHIHKISVFFRSVHEYAAYNGMYKSYIGLQDFGHAKEALIQLLPFYKGKNRQDIFQKISTCEEYLRRAKNSQESAPETY